ncbi:hypothetical protein ACSBR2_036028 [Camellia fascicularis]
MPKLEARRDTSPRDKRQLRFLDQDYRLEAGEAKGESGFILDGFPRTIRQAVLNVLPLRGGPSPRFAQRTLLSTENYQVIYFSEYVAQCVSKLITRSDDTEAVVQERLRIYNEKVNKPSVIFIDEIDALATRYLLSSSLLLVECRRICEQHYLFSFNTDGTILSQKILEPDFNMGIHK